MVTAALVVFGLLATCDYFDVTGLAGMRKRRCNLSLFLRPQARSNIPLLLHSERDVIYDTVDDDVRENRLLSKNTSCKSHIAFCTSNNVSIGCE